MDVAELQTRWTQSLHHAMPTLDRQVLLQQLMCALGDTYGYPQDNLRLLLSPPNFEHKVHVFVNSPYAFTLLRMIPGFEALDATLATHTEAYDRFVTFTLSPKRESIITFDWGGQQWEQETKALLNTATNWSMWLDHFKESLAGLRHLHQGRVGPLPDKFDATVERLREELRHMYFSTTFQTSKPHILDWPSWLLVHPALVWNNASWKSYRMLGVAPDCSGALRERAASLLEVHACLDDMVLDSTLMTWLEQPVATPDEHTQGFDFN